MFIAILLKLEVLEKFCRKHQQNQSPSLYQKEKAERFRAAVCFWITISAGY